MKALEKYPVLSPQGQHLNGQSKLIARFSVYFAYTHPQLMKSR